MYELACKQIATCKKYLFKIDFVPIMEIAATTAIYQEYVYIAKAVKTLIVNFLLSCYHHRLLIQFVLEPVCFQNIIT